MRQKIPRNGRKDIYMVYLATVEKEMNKSAVFEAQSAAEGAFNLSRD
jgi:hypothetical protein